MFLKLVLPLGRWCVVAIRGETYVKAESVVRISRLAATSFETSHAACVFVCYLTVAKNKFDTSSASLPECVPVISRLTDWRGPRNETCEGDLRSN